MSNYVTLLGAEDVQRAASRMSEAAHEMQSAASTTDYAVTKLAQAIEQHEAFLNDWLERFAAVVRGAGTGEGGPNG